MLNARSSSPNSANWKQPSVCSRAMAKTCSQQRWPPPERRPQQRRRRLRCEDAGGVRPQNQLAASAAHRTSAIRSLPWQPARNSRKSLRHAKALAQTMSAGPLPGTNGPAASKSARGSSTPRNRWERSNTPRSDNRTKRAGIKRAPARPESAGRLSDIGAVSPDTAARLAGSLERLPIQTKTELVHLFIDAASNLARGNKYCAPYLGALSHILSRAPVYAGPETFLPPDLVQQAYEAFRRLRTGWRLRLDGPKHGPG